jgi:hypothetical protein
MRTTLQVSGLFVLASLYSMGCYGTARLSPGTSSSSAYSEDLYVYDAAPADIETQPYVEYEGAPAYYVNGRWYRHTFRGWGYYRTEPTLLATRRPYVQSAPPAYRGSR